MTRFFLFGGFAGPQTFFDLTGMADGLFADSSTTACMANAYHFSSVNCTNVYFSIPEYYFLST